MFKYSLNVPPWQNLSLSNLNLHSDFKNELEAMFKKPVLLTNSGRTGLSCYLQNTHWVKQKVLVPAIICSSVVDCVRNAGLEPVIIDVGNDGNIDLEKAKEYLELHDDVGGMVVAHMHGLPVDMGKAFRLCKKHSVKLIDDAAQAFGGKFKNCWLGSFGDCGILSFGPGKMISAGGGALITKHRINVALEDDASRYPQIYWDFYRRKRNSPLEVLKRKLMNKKTIVALRGMNGFDAKINLLQLLDLRNIVRRRQENARVILGRRFNPDCVYTKLVVPRLWIPKERNFQIDIVNPPVGTQEECPNAWEYFESHRVIPNEPWITVEGMEEINEHLQRTD